MTRLPQVLRNVRVARRRPGHRRAPGRRRWPPSSAALGDEGPGAGASVGTEPLVRVMVEAPTEAEAAGRRPPSWSEPSSRGRLTPSAGQPVLPQPPSWTEPERSPVDSADMCGIIAGRPAPRPPDALRRQTRCTARSWRRSRRSQSPLDAGRRGPSRRPATSKRSTSCCAAPTGCTPSSATGACSPRSRAWLPRSPSRSRTALSSQSSTRLGEADGARAARGHQRRSVRLKDAAWAVERGPLPAPPVPSLRLAGAERIVGGHRGATPRSSRRSRPSTGSRCAGRDSAGLTVLVRDHGLDRRRPSHRRAAGRAGRRRAVPVVARCAPPTAACASSTRRRPRSASSATTPPALRDAIWSATTCSASPGAPTRRGRRCWATHGGPASASSPQPNAHPLDSHRSRSAPTAPTWSAALNGDVDNFADLKDAVGLRHRRRDHHRRQGHPHARVAAAGRRRRPGRRLPRHGRPASRDRWPSAQLRPTHPDQLLLALRGSGQALYVGLADGCYIVAPASPTAWSRSPPTYLRMDGDTPANPENPTASRGQIVVLDGSRAGALEGIERVSYDGTPLPVKEHELQHAQITTRDIDRGDFPHFLLKEITEAPASFRKTLRGKLVDREGAPRRWSSGRTTVPDDVRTDLRAGRHPPGAGHRTGHRGMSPVRRSPPLSRRPSARARRCASRRCRPPSCRASACGPKMSDTLVVAISQSGTTTDTNRTVDLCKGARRPSRRDRQPAGSPTSPTRPTACSTRRTGATWR